MDKLKTTEELAQFLRDELQAYKNNKRVHPSISTEKMEENVEREFGPMGANLGYPGLAQIAYYQETRDQVHAYQREHNVSGLVIQALSLGEKTINFPVLASQLIATADDIDVLRAAKERVVEFWADYCRASEAYISHPIYGKNQQQWDVETTLEFVLYFAGVMDWADISTGVSGGGVGASLSVGCGDPYQVDDSRNKNSDVWYFDATTACNI